MGILLSIFRVYAQGAQVLYQIGYPTGVEDTLRPSDIYFDLKQSEIYVADSRNNRVVIFDKRGHYTFEFSDPVHLSGAQQLAVDSAGYIYVLRPSQKSTISVFDYDGRYLREMILNKPGTDSVLDVLSFVLDDDQQIFALTGTPARIFVFSTGGKFLRDFPVAAETDSTARDQPVFGTLSLVDGDLVVPMPILFCLVRFTRTGEFVKVFGHEGGTEGELSFPIAAAADGSGGILVLDKHRHTLIQFDENYKFVREMGGMGMSPGWFYHPIALASNGKDEAYVAQFFQGRVQAIAIKSSHIQ